MRLGSEPRRILVTACGSRTAAAGLARSLHRIPHREFEVFGVDSRETLTPPGFVGADRAPPAGSPEFLGAIRHLVNSHGIVAIIPLIEEDLIALASDNGVDGLSGLVAGGGTLRLTELVNKGSFFEGLRAVASPFCPEYRLVTSTSQLSVAASQLGYPEVHLVLKRRRGRGSRGVYILRPGPLDTDAVGLLPCLPADAAERLVPPVPGGYVVMPYLYGSHETLYGFSAPRHPLRLVRIVREHTTPGITWRGVVVPDIPPAYHRLGTEVARTFSVAGFFGVQLVRTATGPMVYEVNPRYSGSACVLDLAGVNFADLIVSRILGEPEATKFAPTMIKFERIVEVGAAISVD